jgi:hypothetical protein
LQLLDLQQGRFPAPDRPGGVCGIKSFDVPRSNPDGIDVNVRCLDEGTIASIPVDPFDGRNGEANADALAHLSR